MAAARPSSSRRSSSCGRCFLVLARLEERVYAASHLVERALREISLLVEYLPVEGRVCLEMGLLEFNLVERLAEFYLGMRVGLAKHSLEAWRRTRVPYGEHGWCWPARAAGRRSWARADLF